MDAVQLTRELIRFRTVNPPGDEAACARHLGGLLEAAGFRVAYHELAPGRASLVARRGTGERPLALTGHLDVVPLGGTPWQHEPFAGELGGGRLWGRGASDMKAGVAAAVAAAVALGPRLDGTPGVELVLTASEETGSEGAAQLAARPGALGRAGALLVAEPTANRPLVGHKGALWARARTRGVAAHGSMPERGDNAVVKAARAVLLLERFEFGVRPHPLLGGPTLNIGTIAGGANVNSVPDAAVVGIDMRTIPGQHHAEILRRLGAHLGPEVVLEPVLDVAGVWTEPSDPWVASVVDVAGAVTGERAEPGAAPYFTDAAALTPAYGSPPTVILGPGEPALAHQTDEWCAVERIEQAVAVYTELLRRWCGC